MSPSPAEDEVEGDPAPAAPVPLNAGRTPEPPRSSHFVTRRVRPPVGPRSPDVLAPGGPPPQALAPDAPPDQNSDRASRILFRLGVGAATTGLCLLLFLVYAFSFTSFQQARHQRVLLNEFSTPARATLLSGRTPSDGQPAAVLEIPSLRLEQVVVEGTTASDLLLGPGLMPGTARPGSLGNAVIAGHRRIAGAPFAHIDALRAGQRIIVVTGLGRSVYRVERTSSARPGALDPVAPDRHPELTLITSDGAHPTGLDYALATLVSSPFRVPVPRRPPALDERGLAGDPGAVAPTIVWGLVLAAAFAAAFAAFARWPSRRWTTYLLGAPIILAIALIWYGNLVRLLPSTI